MKSETQTKIIESRKRYFKELKMQMKNENRDLNPIAEVKPATFSAPETELKSRSKTNYKIGAAVWDVIKSMLEILTKETSTLMQKTSMLSKQISNRLLEGSNFISDRVSARTEKTRARIFSFLLVLFDAGNS